jgi:hypothetical protein
MINRYELALGRGPKIFVGGKELYCAAEVLGFNYIAR